MSRFAKYLHLVLAAMAIIACQKKHQQASQPEEATIPFGRITDFDTEDALRLSLLDNNQAAHEWIRARIATAEALLVEANKIREADALGRLGTPDVPFVDTSASGPDGPADPRLRETAGNLPIRAADLMSKAANEYWRIVQLFDESRHGIDYDRLVDKDQCAGMLYRHEFFMCREILRSAKLYALAEQRLSNYLADGSEHESFNKYIYYMTAAEGVLGDLSGLRNQALARWIAINEGSTEAIDSVSVPYLALIADPSKIQSRIANELSEYKAAVEKMMIAQTAVLQSQVDRVDLATRRRELKKERSAILNDRDQQDLSFQGFESERQYLTDEADRIIKQMENNSRKFALEMRAVMGEPGASTQLGSDQRLAVRPNGAAVEPPLASELEITGFSGLLDVSAAAMTYKANGIYFEDVPTNFKPTAFSVKVKSVSVSGVKNIGQQFATAGKPVTNFAHDHKGAIGGAMVGGFMGGPLGMMAGAAIGGKSIDGGSGAEQLNPMQFIQSGVRTMAGEGLNMAAAAIPGGMTLATPLALAKSLEKDLAELDFPQLSTNVYRQMTNANGYMLSRSYGTNVGVSNGESSSSSVGVSIGASANAGVVFAGAGANAGASAGVQRGTSTGASAGKNSGLSFQVGFFHPKAHYRSVQVGALVAEVVCGDQVEAAHVVGLSNFVPIHANSSCPMRKVRFLINDRLDVANNTCDPNPELGSEEQACSSSTPLPITVRKFQSVEAAWSKLYAIVVSQDIKEAIHDAAYSADPYGSAYRIFAQRAREQGIAEIYTERFKAVLGQNVAIQLDYRELRKIGQALEQLGVKQTKAAREQGLSIVRASLVDEADIDTMDLQALRNAQATFHTSKLNIDTSFANYHLDRLARWIGYYRASVKYHQNRDIPDPIVTLKVSVEKVLTQALDQAVSKGLDAGLDVLRRYTDTLVLKTFVDTETDRQWFHDLATQVTMSHCRISVGDLVVGGPSPKDVRQLFTMATGTDSSRYPNMRINKGTDEFDPELAEGMAFRGAGGDPDFDGYFKVRLKTDPRATNIIGYHQDTPDGDGPARISQVAAMRCQNNEEAGLAKIVGVAFTYSTEDSIPLPNSMYLSHESPMFTYHEGRKIFRLVDWWSANGAFGPEVNTKFTRVNLVNDAAAQSNRCRVGGQETWTEPECYKFLLGHSLQKGVSGGEDFKVSFFNSYVGGDWNIFVPYARDIRSSWSAMGTHLESLDMHLYFARTERRF